MGVTHVLRGDDHLTNTPRQLMLLDALGMRRPDYGHVGLLVGVDGAPLSKRHGSTSVAEFRERGFLAAALLNHLFRLGHTSDVEGWLAPDQMPPHFRPEHLGRASARFEESQLVHWQKETLRHMSVLEIARLAGGAGLGGVRRPRAPQRGAPEGCRPLGVGGARRAAAARCGGAAGHRCGRPRVLRRRRRCPGPLGPGFARARRVAQEGDGRRAVRSSTCPCGWRSPAARTDRSSRRS